MAQLYTGIDIGSKTIKLVQLKRGRGDSVQLVNLAETSLHPKDESIGSSMESVATVAESVQRLLAEQKIRAPQLITAIPKHLTTVRSITLPTNDLDEIENMVRFEAGKHIPFLAEDDILDFQIMGASAIGGSQVLLVAVRKQIIDDHLALLKKIGLEPKIVSVSSIAIYTALKQSGQLEEGAVQVLIDIGASMTDLTLVQNRILVYSRSVTVAGNQLIQRLQEEFQIDETTAESMLPLIDLNQPNFGIDTYHRDKLAQAISPWLELLDNEIKQSLEYFRSESGVTQIDSVILSGGLSNLTGFPAHLEKELNLEIALANPINNIEIRNPNLERLSNKLLPSLNVAVGLGLRGIDTTPGAGINLLPADLLQKRKQTVQRRNYIAVGAFAGLILLTASFAGYHKYSYRETRIQQIKLKLQEISPLAVKLKEMQAQVERIKGMFSPDDAAPAPRIISPVIC